MTKKSTNYKALHGPALVESGYMLVPIKSGEKHPMTKAWPQLRATLDDVNKWARSSYYGGLGVLGKFSPGIDIDVSDQEVTAKILKWCAENIGPAPIRIGNAPRALIPCSAPAGGLGPDNSPKFESPDGKTHQIEIKATGQQWVAYGVHPKTGNSYTWMKPDGYACELHEVEADWLPTLTGEKIDELFKYFESILPSEWERLGSGRTRAKTGGLTPDGLLTGAQSFENYKPPVNVDSDRVVSILKDLDPDAVINGKGWRTVGMALYHQYEGSEVGKQIFTEWSERSNEYDFDEITARWPSWGEKSYGGAPVTFATVLQMHKEVMDERRDPTREQKSKKLSDWEERFILVEQPDGTEVHDAGAPLHKTERKLLRAFREHNSAYVHRTMTPEGELKVVPMVEAWKDSLHTRHFSGYTYQPGRKRFCHRENAYGDDRMFVNTFYFPPHPESPEGELDTFWKFLEHLFPEPQERDFIVQWLARLIQTPWVRSFVTPISITPVTGTGRGIFFEIIRAVIGGHNTHDVSRDDMEGRFNGFLDKCIVAVVQEIKAATGDHKYQMWERMKSLLADTTANVQAKGENSYTATIYANFLMFSNNIDALPLTEVTERRIYAMRGATRPISYPEIDAINKWKANSVNVAALFNHLKALEVDHSLFKRAPISETKTQMVRASTGLDGADLTHWLQNEAPKVFDYEYAVQNLEESSPDFATVGISRDSFRRKLADKGYHSHRIRNYEGERTYAFYRPQDVPRPLSAALLKKLLNQPPEDFLK